MNRLISPLAAALLLCGPIFAENQSSAIAPTSAAPSATPSASSAATLALSGNDLGIHTVSLDGTWDFAVAEGKWSAGNETDHEVDETAARITGSPAGLTGWMPVEVPQFLNHTKWWCQRVSDAYEKQEDERVAKLPPGAVDAKSGWYLKKIDLPTIKGLPPEIRIDFEGIAMVSRVYCNGEYVGGYRGMFGGVEARLTPHLKWGGKNQILVFVQRGVEAKDSKDVVGVAVTISVTRGMFSALNRGVFGSFGRTADAKFMGIWLPVTLSISNPGGRVKDVFFNPALDGHRIDFTLENPESHEVKGEIHYRITDSRTGELLSEEIFPVMTIPAGGEKHVTAEKSGLHPKLWTPDDPNLYDLAVSWVSPEGTVIDLWKNRVGYRTVTVKGAFVSLNGKPYWARGTDMPPYGYKPNSEDLARNFFQRMHDGNQMVTRAHCNPLNRMWYNLADEIGIGISAEGVRPWALMSKMPPPPPAILNHWKQEEVAVRKRYRNHPSILFDCISNEGLQGDESNQQKLAIFKEVIDAVRAVDPARPVFQTSGERDMNGAADIDDVHSYWGWYAPSSYVNDYTKPMPGLSATPGRPFLNQEVGVPYLDTDTGGVLPIYVDKFSAQPWVGELGARGTNTSYFTEHNRGITKLTAEKLRYQRREQPTAGMMLFGSLTWIENILSKPSGEWKPFPVWDALKKSFAPVLVALETTQSFFYTGADVPTRVFVVNDDSSFRDLTAGNLTLRIVGSDGSVLSTQELKLGAVPYFGIKDWPLTIKMPDLPTTSSAPVKATIMLTLKEGGRIISENSYPVRIASHAWATAVEKKPVIAAQGCPPVLLEALSSIGSRVMDLGGADVPADVVVLGPSATGQHPDTILKHLKPGGRLLLLEQGEGISAFCGDVLKLPEKLTGSSEKLSPQNVSETIKGEFVEMIDWEKNPSLYRGLDAMDWKWWAQGSGNPAFVSIATHRIDLTNPLVQPIGSYLPPHSYWVGDNSKISKTLWSYPVFAVKRSWGELIVSELVLAESLAYDPRAARTLANLLTEPVHIQSRHPWIE